MRLLGSKIFLLKILEDLMRANINKILIMLRSYNQYEKNICNLLKIKILKLETLSHARLWLNNSKNKSIISLMRSLRKRRRSITKRKPTFIPKIKSMIIVKIILRMKRICKIKQSLEKLKNDTWTEYNRVLNQKHNK